MDSFLSGIDGHLKKMPDYRTKGLADRISAKCTVLPFPVSLPKELEVKTKKSYARLHVVWPHRWEHDKNPESFFECLFRLKEEGYTDFGVSVLGGTFSEEPEIFNRAREVLRENIVRFGHLESKAEYYDALSEANVVVSTANHEFFGAAVAEAVLCGCYPLVPERYCSKVT